MKEKTFNVITLENHQTKDISGDHVNGNLTVIWRDWDKILPTSPKMIYITSVFPGEVKGPHIHELRTSYFICIEGRVVFVIQDGDGGYHEIIADSKEPSMIVVPNKIASAHKNLYSDTSKILVLADIAWKPNDNEMKNITFENYDWNKWESEN